MLSHEATSKAYVLDKHMEIIGAKFRKIKANEIILSEYYR
jgi:hypothetical protein